MQQMPLACASLLRALNDFLHPQTHVVIRAAKGAEAASWEDAIHDVEDAADVYLIPPEGAVLPGILGAQAYRTGGVAYLCRGTRCEPPIMQPADLTSALKSV